MLRIGVCDDEQDTLRNNCEIVQDFLRKRGINGDIAACSSGQELLWEAEQHGDFQIILLDIEMDGFNGVETAKKLRERDYYTVLIFISAHDQYCKALMNVKPFAFLDKPVNQKQLFQVLDRVMEQEIAQSENFCFTSGKVRYQVDIKSILYFESSLRKILLAGRGKSYWFYGRMDEVEARISASGHKFLRIHKSYLVNVRYIESYHYTSITMQNGKQLNISKARLDSIREYYRNQLL